MYILKILNRYSIIYFLLAIITVFTITAWLVQPFSEEDYDNLLTISAFIIFFICGLILLIFMLKFNIQAQAKKAWLLTAAAIFSWAIGEFFYILYEFVLKAEDPLIGDLFRLLGYPIFILGLVMQWRTLEIQIKKVEALLFFILFGLCLIAILTVLNVPLLLLDTESILIAAYPTLDLFLTFISGMIGWKVKRKKMVFPWVIFTQ